jgi:hypothetical protein
MFPVLFFFSILLIIIVNVLLYRVAGMYFPAKRKYLVPSFIFSLAWPVLESFWAHDIGDWPDKVHMGYDVHHGLYTFDTRQPVAGFIYYTVGPHVHLPTLLSFCDILLVSALFSLLIYGFSSDFKRRP